MKGSVAVLLIDQDDDILSIDILIMEAVFWISDKQPKKERFLFADERLAERLAVQEFFDFGAGGRLGRERWIARDEKRRHVRF